MEWNKCNGSKNLPDNCRRVLVTNGKQVYEANLGMHGKWIHPAYNACNEDIVAWAEIPEYKEAQDNAQ